MKGQTMKNKEIKQYWKESRETKKAVKHVPITRRVFIAAPKDTTINWV
jgi:hypothetical protein